MADHGFVKIENLTVVYPNGFQALKEVDLSLQSGKIYGLVGANGAGKSTLFKAMMGFLTPTAGRVLVAGNAVHRALQKKMISYVPQTEEVDWNFPVLAQDVVMMGRYGYMGFLRRPSRTDIDMVDESLEKVGMIEYKKRQIGELSGGQKKRIFVARALAQNGRVLLLDEPFAGVDIKTEEALIALFKSLVAEQRLILTSTHNLGSVPNFCDQVILINKRVLASGSVAETFNPENLALAFGGMLRHHQLVGRDLHEDEDYRGVTVMSDDERPLVLYGKKGGQKIVSPKDNKND